LLGASSPTTSPISSAPSPRAQRESPVRQYWHGRTPTKIGRHLDRTPATAAGLLKRGLKNLRQELQAERRANQTFPPGGPLRTTHRLLSATLLCSALCAFAAAAEPDPPKRGRRESASPADSCRCSAPPAGTCSRRCPGGRPRQATGPGNPRSRPSISCPGRARATPARGR